MIGIIGSQMGGSIAPPVEPTASDLILTSYNTTSNGSEDLLIYLPEGYGDTPGQTFPVHFFYHGDGATGSFLDRTAEVMTNAGGNLYTHVCDNPTGSSNRRVYFKSVVIKVAGVEVARARRTMNGTTATIYSTGAIAGITGTINIAQYPGSEVNVQFPSAPGGTVTIDYQMSKLFETGIPYYLNAGAYDWSNTIVVMVQKGASGTFYSINDHYLELKAHITANYNCNWNRFTVSGISRGGVFVEALAQSTYRSQIAAFVQLSGLAFGMSGITADFANKGVMIVAGQSEGLDGYSVPNGSVMNTFATASTDYKFYPGSIMVQSGRHNGGTWNSYWFDISTAVANGVTDFRDWLYPWSIDNNEQVELFVDWAEQTQDVNRWREAKRVVSFEPAGAAKTAWETRLAAVRTAMGTKKKWLLDFGAVTTDFTDANPYMFFNNLSTSFAAGTTYSSLRDDLNNVTTLGLTVGSQLSASPTNRFSTSTRGSNPQYGHRYNTYNDGINLQTTVTTGFFTLTGLDPAKLYKITFYPSNGSTSSAHNMSVTVTIGGTTKSMFNTYTNARLLTFGSITPNGSGEVVVNMYASGDTGMIMNAMLLEEQ